MGADMAEVENLPANFGHTINRYCLLLLLPMSFLIGIHLVLHYLNHHGVEIHWLIMQLFELDEENNLPTWFSSFLLLNVAALLTLFKLTNIAGSRETFRYHWTVLIIGFLVLSIDEVAGLHETVNTAVEIHWAIPALFVLVIAGLPFIPFLTALPNGIGILYMVYGLMYVGGAIGIELLSKDMERESYIYSLATAAEEGVEMIAIWLFLHANCREFLKAET